MHVVPFGVSNVPKCQHVQLRLASTAQNMKRDKYGPCDQASDRTYDADDFEKS
jgi:hypothetical protein